jgi:WD40 repeat protein
VLYVLSVPSRSMILNTIFSSPIQSLGFSKLDERLSVGSKDGLLTLLSPESNWEPVGEIELSESRVLAQDWSFKHLAVGREDGSVAVFENEKVYSHFFVSQAELSQKQAVRSVAFDAAGRFLGTL